MNAVQSCCIPQGCTNRSPVLVQLTGTIRWAKGVHDPSCIETLLVRVHTNR